MNEYPNIFALEKIYEYLDKWIYLSKYIQIYSNIRIFVPHCNLWWNCVDISTHWDFVESGEGIVVHKLLLLHLLQCLSIYLMTGNGALFVNCIPDSIEPNIDGQEWCSSIDSVGL